MFKFGFLDDAKQEDSIEASLNLKWFASSEIVPEEVIFSENLKTNVLAYGQFSIKFISDKDVIHMLQDTLDNSVLKADQNHSDLVTASYEGGLKIWECTFDLLDYLDKANLDLVGKTVLDLGCGAGLIGIFACLKGSNTIFQDYNKEVIKSATIPNVSLNQINFSKCNFYCGDWESFLNLVKNRNEKLDFIFTSETIYNTNNYQKLINIFKNLLKKSGTIYLAAKLHYFGVGGGIAHFRDLLDMEDIFNHTVCWECSSGVKRAILKLTFK